MGITLTVSMAIVWWGRALLTWESLEGKVFCDLRHQSLVSMATAMGFQQLGGRVWRVARSWGALGQPVPMVRAGELNVGSLSGQLGEEMVFRAVGKNGDIQK